MKDPTIVREWLIIWFVKNAYLSRDEVDTRIDYLGKGWIDSLKFIELVSAIEGHFGIAFSNDEFQNRTFATIDGLTRIIAGKLHGEE